MNAVPSIEDLIKGFADGGWDALSGVTDRTDQEKSRRESRQQAIADDVLWVARTPQGLRVLNFILDNSLRRASWHGDLRFTMEQVAPYGLLREGQNSIAAMLVAALRLATGGDVSILTTPTGEKPHDRYAWFRAACRSIIRACRAARQ